MQAVVFTVWLSCLYSSICRCLFFVSWPKVSNRDHPCRGSFNLCT